MEITKGRSDSLAEDCHSHLLPVLLCYACRQHTRVAVKLYSEVTLLQVLH